MFGGSSAVRVYANDYISLITLRIYEEALRHLKAGKIYRTIVKWSESNNGEYSQTTLRRVQFDSFGLHDPLREI